MSFFNVKEKKVALLIATFFLMSFVYANESLSERAEELFLKKKRVEAIELLLSAAESVSNKNKSSYLALAKRMGSIFYQNKTQQYYEKGEFHLYKSPDIAAELFQAGLKIEPDNFKLLLGYARSQLYLKNGKAIFELITEKQWLLKIDSVFFRLAVSAAASEGSEKNLVKYIKEGKEVWKDRDRQVHTLYLLQLGEAELKNEKNSLLMGSLIEPIHPDLYYWKWKESQFGEKVDWE
ncbi:MAG: hypothetical protein KDD61_12265, partial [Bdellovibrionales bacterium]|nr:hypothetical protein [Bdellovibrionales bacterium]